MRIVVLSNTTMRPLGPHLPDHELVFSEVGDLPIWLADPTSPANDPTTDLVLVHVDGEAVLPARHPEHTVGALLDQLESFVTEHPLVPIVITTFLASARSASSYADAIDPSGRVALRAHWDLTIARLAVEHLNVSVLDLNILLEDSGRRALVNDAYWYLGRIRFSKLGFELLGRELKRIMAGILSQAHKVLVLDLDNTLWGGVIGEEGLGGIELGEDGVGKCYRDFQQHLRHLGHSGVLLAVVSKNDPAIVDDAFSNHPMMILTRDDLVSVQATWNNKADSISNLAHELSLGLDSFVFIDDNPLERALVQSVLPEVAVPDFPARPESLSSWLLDDVVPTFFPRARVLAEDRGKTKQYQARETRSRLQKMDLGEFLATLEMRVTFRVDDEQLIPRLSQLTQKTNQFNLTTERASPADIGAWMADSSMAVVACDYADRFGDEGTIGLAVIDVKGGRVMNLLLSCRVLGRGVEDLLLAESRRIAAAAGAGDLSMRFVASPRNDVARGFLVRHGFHEDDSGSNLWRETGGS